MKTSHLLLTLALALYVSAQYAVPSVHDECESSCSSSDPNCCGCCGSDSTCSGNSISKRCCPSNSGFCGCISNRAFCSGSVFNNTNRVNGTDSFGSCFDTSAATCTYDPSPNLWIVCPITHTSCKSASFYTCCGPDTVCTTTSIDSYPICAAKPAETQIEENDTEESNSGLAVPSENPSCQADCSPSNNTCCGCCSDDRNCAGNDISRRCCPANSGFCGCISNRAFCSGSIYNSTYGSVSGYDSFGACFDASSGATCTYNPNPNLWIVCPKDYTACESASFFSCCSPDSVCTTTSSSSYPICTPKAQTMPPIQSTTGQNENQGNCPAPLKSCGGACYSDSEYCCPAGQLVQKQFCGSNDGSSTTNQGGNPTPSTVNPPSQGNCGANLYACGDACYTQDQYCCVNGQLTQKQFCTPSGGSSTTNQEQTPAPSTANPPQQGNCPSPLKSCGDACYSEEQYCCPNGQLTQKQFC